MMYPQYQYGGSKSCGGTYSLHGNVCTWEVVNEGDRVTARIYGDYRHEGKAYTYPTRRDALVALAAMIYGEEATA